MILGEDIKGLIPQREPFIMLDSFEQNDDSRATAGLTVRSDNYFLLPDGTLSPTALIEHAAQACSALAAVRAGAAGHPPVGLLGEVKHFECQRRVGVGEQVTTEVTFDLTFGNVTIARGECRVGSEAVATLQLKIFMQA